MITAVVNPENVHHITHSLRREHYGVTILEGNRKRENDTNEFST